MSEWIQCHGGGDDSGGSLRRVVFSFPSSSSSLPTLRENQQLTAAESELECKEEVGREETDWMARVSTRLLEDHGFDQVQTVHVLPGGASFIPSPHTLPPASIRVNNWTVETPPSWYHGLVLFLHLADMVDGQDADELAPPGQPRTFLQKWRTFCALEPTYENVRELLNMQIVGTTSRDVDDVASYVKRALVFETDVRDWMVHVASERYMVHFVYNDPDDPFLGGPNNLFGRALSSILMEYRVELAEEPEFSML